MIRQISRFAGVGMIATAVHVIGALLAKSAGLSPQAANAIGFAAAVGTSYLGHGRFTFGTKLRHRVHGSRFIATASLGLAVSSCLTYVITGPLGLPFGLAMAAVALAVPAGTFVLCRLWVFAPDQSGSR